MKDIGSTNYDVPLGRLIIKSLFISLLILLILSIVILSWVPPISRDALTHHLAIPKLYLQHGGIYEIPSIVFAYYPMNLDLLYMIPLYFGNDIAPKFIPFLFALLTAWLLNSYLRKRVGAGWALFGVLFFLSIPIIVKLSITVYVDLGLVFFSFASIIGLLKWIDSQFQFKFLILSAAGCGLALGTKYNGLLVLFILTVFIPLIYLRREKRHLTDEKKTNTINTIKNPLKAFGFAAVFFSVALAVFSPWMIKNYKWKGNPIYPLYNNVFNPRNGSPVEFLDNKNENTIHENKSLNSKKSFTRWGSFAIRKVIYHESTWEIALIPVRIFFQGRDGHPKYFDGRLNAFLFFLPIFAFFPSRNDKLSLKTEKKIFLFFSLLYLLFAFSQADMRIRYIAPIIPPLVILAILGIKRIAELGTNSGKIFAGKLRSGTVILIAAAMLVINAAYIYSQFKYVEPFDYIRGRISRDDYIGKYRTEHPVIQYANKNLRNDAKILAIFLGNRRYYSERELVFGNGLFRKLVKNTDSSDRLAAEIREKGFTHLIIRYDIFDRWSAVQFNANEIAMLRTFFKNHMSLLFSQSGYGLMQIEPLK